MNGHPRGFITDLMKWVYEIGERRFIFFVESEHIYILVMTMSGWGKRGIVGFYKYKVVEEEVLVWLGGQRVVMILFIKGFEYVWMVYGISFCTFVCLIRFMLVLAPRDFLYLIDLCSLGGGMPKIFPGVTGNGVHGLGTGVHTTYYADWNSMLFLFNI